MWKLWGVFGIGMVLAILSDKNSIYRYDSFGAKKYIRHEIFLFLFMTIFLTVYVGLRTTYNDTETYRQNYMMFTTTDFSDVDLSLGENPGFNLINTYLKSKGVSTQNFLMIYAWLTVPVYLWFLKKYTDNLSMTIFFFFTMGCYTFTMAAIKQCVAVAFCLIATDRAIRQKWLSFILWILFAATLHPYALMYLIIPLLMFRPWTKQTYWMLLLCGGAGLSLQAMLGTIVSITSMMGEAYDASSFSGAGISIFRLAVVWVPVVISFFTKRFWLESQDRASNLIMNLSMLNAEIMFIALFGTANYFGRLANYFLIFQTISMASLFKYFNKESRKLLMGGAVVGYLLYFYYANGIGIPFDGAFNRISIFKYLSSF